MTSTAKMTDEQHAKCFLMGVDIDESSDTKAPGKFVVWIEGGDMPMPLCTKGSDNIKYFDTVDEAIEACANRKKLELEFCD